MTKNILLLSVISLFTPLLSFASNAIPVSSLFSKNEPIAVQETKKLVAFCTDEFKFEPLKYKSESYELLNKIKYKLEAYRWSNGKIAITNLRVSLRKISFVIDQKINKLIMEHCMIDNQVDLTLKIADIISDAITIEKDLDLKVGDKIISLNGISVNPINYSSTIRSLNNVPIEIEIDRNGTSITKSFVCPINNDCILGFRYDFVVDNTMFSLERSTDQLVHMLRLVKRTLDNLT